jgi:hypothetical protein
MLQLEKGKKFGASVCFSTIEIKEYPIIAGDNPAVTIGAPITIDWIPFSDEKCTVDDYEERRPSPRSMVELRMPSTYRMQLLRSLGFTREEVQKCIKAANITRNHRSRTNETMALFRAQESLEMMTRAMLNVTFRRTAKKREKLIMNSYLPINKKFSIVFFDESRSTRDTSGSSSILMTNL